MSLFSFSSCFSTDISFRNGLKDEAFLVLVDLERAQKDHLSPGAGSSLLPHRALE